MTATETKPEWVKCIKHTSLADMFAGKTWCGKEHSMKASFESIDHAVYNRANDGRLMACPECLKAICSQLFKESIHFEVVNGGPAGEAANMEVVDGVLQVEIV